MTLEQQLLTLIQSPSFTSEEVYTATKQVEGLVFPPGTRFWRTEKAQFGPIILERQRSCWRGVTTYRLYRMTDDLNPGTLRRKGYELQVKGSEVLSVHKIYEGSPSAE